MSIYEKAFPSSAKTDAILVVDGKKLHVNKAFLSCNSDYFNSLFNSEFGEKSMAEIPIREVEFEDFATLLSLVHPTPIKPTKDQFEKLIELSDRFMLPGAKNRLESFMVTSCSAVIKLYWAESTD
ncbi:hypothetical protein CRE_21079 [Caenorhabditis remanei]|uniref:BTB domain-containing protein n=1 Tax=Caenorhabditis remanei TaxID=31234 RepID=E3NS50_CAERE|nr:hypothetical protein CRE_21079 [Caenorhabditis remanei]